MKTGDGQHGDDGLRAILVGRTGLDQALRRDPSIEVVRAGDAFDAVGELGDPIDDESPRRAVVVVGAGGEPTDDIGGADAFRDALRRVDAQVRVVAVDVAQDADRYDLKVSPGLDAAGFREACAAAPMRATGTDAVVVHGPVAADPPREHAPEPTLEPQRPEPKPSEPQRPEPAQREPVRAESPPARPERTDNEPAERAPFAGHVPPPGPDLSIPDPPPAASGVPRGRGVRETALVEAMLAGRDVLEPAMSVLRERLGGGGVRFTHGESGVPVETSDAGGCRRFGALVSPDGSVAEASLREEAAWLAGWLRLADQRRELERAAFTDPLTGAWNRRYFERYLEAAIVRARAARLPLTVMVFDIDNFKSYNDRFGHAAGDEILVETVRLLQSVIRPSDRVCRIGGDEFVVIFYEPGGPRDAASKPPDSISQIATRFQRQVCEHRFPKLGTSAQGTLTISGGLATYPWDGVDASSLLARADGLAMQSKRQGKNALMFGPGAQQACQAHPPRH